MQVKRLFTGVGRRDFLFSLGSIALASGIVVGTVIAGDVASVTAVPQQQGIQPVPSVAPTGTSLLPSTTRARAPRTAPEPTRGTATATTREAAPPTTRAAPRTTKRRPPPSTVTTLPSTSTTRCHIHVTLTSLELCIRR